MDGDTYFYDGTFIKLLSQVKQAALGRILNDVFILKKCLYNEKIFIDINSFVRGCMCERGVTENMKNFRKDLKQVNGK